MKKILCAIAIAMLATTTFAAEKGGYMDKSSPIVAADKGDGCGLGWQITQKRTLVATTTRQTTNAFVPPTFGMTSGTIGCEQHQFAKNDMAAATYAATNFENLRIEMAEGRGENLAAFAETMGCDAASFGSVTKANYRSIMSGASESPIQMYKNLKVELAKSGACGV